MGVVLFAGTGETATLSNTFTVNGIATDPGTITLAVTDPTGATSTYTYAGAQITKSGIGAYWKEIPVAIVGEWSYVWTGTAPCSDVNHGSFTVLETNLSHLYVTPQSLKSRVGIASTDATSDLELQKACYAASRCIETYCSRVFWQGTDTRVFDNAGDLWFVDFGPYNDVVSVTTVKVDNDGDGVFEQTLSGATDYQLLPVNRSGPETRPFTSMKRTAGSWPIVYWPQARAERIQVTGVFGWPAVPYPVISAAEILGAELFKMKDAPFGIAAFGEYGPMRVRQNPEVERLLQPYLHGAGGFIV